jgi:hypothetical protein
MSSLSQQPSISRCPACGGQRVGATTYEMVVGRRKLKGGKVVMPHRLQALVCVTCGLTTFHIENMEAFREELRTTPEGFTY